jgi:hypothetical protein
MEFIGVNRIRKPGKDDHSPAEALKVTPLRFRLDFFAILETGAWQWNLLG